MSRCLKSMPRHFESPDGSEIQVLLNYSSAKRAQHAYRVNRILRTGAG